MQDNKEDSTDQQPGDEDPQPSGLCAEQVVQPREVDQKRRGVHDGQVGDHQQPLAMIVERARDLPWRVVLAQPHSGRDQRLRHQRDNENDARHPGTSLPRP